MNQVRKIFFENDSPYPSFVMERGGVRRPHKLNGRIAWFTDSEVKEYISQQQTTAEAKIEKQAKEYSKTFNPITWLRSKLA